MRKIKLGGRSWGYGRCQMLRRLGSGEELHNKKEYLDMRHNSQAIHAVPTNIITGFLGVGKTTAILHLLKSKPANERWAILVNEFGEIGVDGGLFEGQHNQEQGVFIREVPGGCMCCATGLPMQVALNQLLILAKPDRLLIEPTGLGHPKEILQTLSSEHYEEILDIDKILTLVDARKVSDERYTTHEIFNQQIAIADIVVGNKSDLYQPEDNLKLEMYVKQHGSSETQVIFTENAEIESSYLSNKTSATFKGHHHNSAEQSPPLSEAPIPMCGYIKANNEGEGFQSIGWRFSPSRVFDHERLFTFLNTIDAERMKAVFITDRGIFGYNLTSDALTEIKLDGCVESRVEIISDSINDEWETLLMSCILTK
jgi:G3E family GTPase